MSEGQQNHDNAGAQVANLAYASTRESGVSARSANLPQQRRPPG